MRVARVLSADMASGTRHPSRVLRMNVGSLGEFTSVGQYALIDESDLVGRNVVIVANLGDREMGPYVSQALVLGVPHPDSPADQAQAMPVFVGDRATPGDAIF